MTKKQNGPKRLANPKQLNKDYFKSFITTRASLGMLRIAWVGILIGALLTWMVWVTGLVHGLNSPFNPATLSLLISACFMVCLLLAAVVKPLRKFFYRHQRFSSVWQVVFVVAPLYQLIFLTFIMVTAERRTVMMYTSLMAVPYMLFASAAYPLCCVYNVFWLHPQLQIGMSEERQRKNPF